MARNWCKNYRGMHEKQACEAGVRFDSLPFHGTKQFMGACPCFGPKEGCELAAYPTEEEMAAGDEEIEARLVNYDTARQAIVNHLGGPWKHGTSGAGGVIDCPVCKQPDSLQFSRAGYNGHIHARCKTDGCVSWME